MINVNDLTSILIKALFDSRQAPDASTAEQNAATTAPSRQDATTAAQAEAPIQGAAPTDSTIKILAPLDVKGRISEAAKKISAATDKASSAPPEARPAGKETPAPPVAAAPDWSSGFSKGEVISGSVTKSLGPEAAIIRLRGTDLVASTPRPLSDGAPITVKVESLRPQFTLTLLTDDARMREKTAALLRASLPTEAPIADVLKSVSELLAKLPPEATQGSALADVMVEINKSVKNPEGKSSKNPAQLLGLSHEAAISKGRPEPNLKHSLMVVRGNLGKMREKSYGPHVEQLQKVNDAISNIELRQVLGAANTGDVKGWQMPYWNGQKVDSGTLYIGKDKAGNAGKGPEQGTRLTLTVSMSDLGDVRAEALGRKNMLDGTIYAGTDAAVKRLQDGLDGLLTSLANVGYSATIRVQKADHDFITRVPETEAPLPIQNLLSLRV